MLPASVEQTLALIIVLDTIIALEPTDLLILQVEALVIIEVLLLETVQIEAVVLLEGHQDQAEVALMEGHPIVQVEVLHLEDPHLVQEVVVPWEDHPLPVADLLEAVPEAVVHQEVAHPLLEAEEVDDNIESTFKPRCFFYNLI